jgi:hypothetical protein
MPTDGASTLDDSDRPAAKRPRNERELLDLEERRALEGILAAAQRTVTDISNASGGFAFARRHPVAVAAASAVAGWFAARGASRFAVRVAPLIGSLVRGTSGSGRGAGAMRGLAAVLRAANRSRGRRCTPRCVRTS